jgi:cysteine desulfurase family protein
MQRRYLDNAATSWPKPECVYRAADDYLRNNGASVGRAATRQGGEIQAIVDRARRRAAELLGAESPKSIAFTFNGSDALNAVIHGWLSPGDHVITSVAEHNSILRPLRWLQERLSIAVDYAPVDAFGLIDPQAIRNLIRPRTRLIALTHASNVTGALQPIEEIAQVAHDEQVPILIDAAQSAGHIPLNLRSLPVDFLACSGHKGLLGPLGTGLLYVRPGRERELRPFRQGGTGSVSESEQPPEQMPDRFEVGNHNAPGLAGLDASLGWLIESDISSLRRREIELTGRLLDSLRSIPGVEVVGPPQPEQRVGVVSFRLAAFDPQTCASLLDEEFGIETRAGLHCAPRMHRTLGTLTEGGLIRLSIGHFTTEEDIDAVADALRALTEAAPARS